MIPISTPVALDDLQSCLHFACFKLLLTAVRHAHLIAWLAPVATRGEWAVQKFILMLLHDLPRSTSRPLFQSLPCTIWLRRCAITWLQSFALQVWYTTCILHKGLANLALTQQCTPSSIAFSSAGGLCTVWRGWGSRRHGRRCWWVWGRWRWRSSPDHERGPKRWRRELWRQHWWWQRSRRQGRRLWWLQQRRRQKWWWRRSALPALLAPLNLLIAPLECADLS